jgi:hypothetical protein
MGPYTALSTSGHFEIPSLVRPHRGTLEYGIQLGRPPRMLTLSRSPALLAVRYIAMTLAYPVVAGSLMPWLEFHIANVLTDGRRFRPTISAFSPFCAREAAY